MLKKLLKKFLTKLYKIEIKGLENYEKAGKRVLIVANHLSFLDAILLAVFLPKKPIFAINSFIASKWWIKPFNFVTFLNPRKFDRPDRVG